MIPLWLKGFINIHFFKGSETAFFCVLRIPCVFRQMAIFITFIIGTLMDKKRAKKEISIYFLRANVKPE